LLGFQELVTAKARKIGVKFNSETPILSFLLPSRYCEVDSARQHHALILSGCWMPRPEAQFFSAKFQSHENID
jgi:hypothetical protein